jgi:hypothetical protein
MKTEIKLINKEIAKMLLKTNVSNRSLNSNNVSFLSKQMQEGAWLFDGQPIRLDTYGRLMDGQHRLQAIIDTNSSFEFVVISGLEPETFKVMDTGRGRTASDVFSISGVQNYAVASSISRFILAFQFNHYARSGGNGKKRISNTDALEFYNSNKYIKHICDNVIFNYMSFNRIVSTSILGGVWFIFAEKNVTDAENFIEKLCQGNNLDSNSPIHLLRKKLTNNKMSFRKMSQKEVLALIIKTWNAVRLNKTVNTLRFDKEREKFPTIL